MSGLIERIRELTLAGEIRISEHGYDEMADDGLTAQEVIAGIRQAVVVEEYPNYPKGPCVLLLQTDRAGKPVHAVWGIPKGHTRPVVLITAYRPDATRWEPDFLTRSKR